MYDHDILSILTERLIPMDSWNQKPSIASEVKRELCSNRYLRFIFLLNHIKERESFAFLFNPEVVLHHHIEPQASVASQLCSCLHICFLWFNLLFLFDNLGPFRFIFWREKTITKFENKKGECTGNKISSFILLLKAFTKEQSVQYCWKPKKS